MNLKIKIMNPKPKVSDEEIRNFMDFDSILQQRNAVLRKRRMLVKSGVVILAVAVLVTAFLLYNSQERNNPKGSGSDSVAANASTVAVDPKTVTDTSGRVPEISDETAVVQEDKTKAHQETSVPRQYSESETARVKEEETVAENIYLQAEPVDGYEKLFAYFRENLKYPQQALKDSVQGVMKISFVIDLEGKPGDVRIEETLGPLFDLEAKTLIKSMPAWKPALLNGKPVRSRISLPLTFEVKKVNR